MKLLIIFLAVFYGSRLGSSVPQKNCICSDHTETDHRGQQIGKCQTKFSGKNWCYIESNSNCADKKKSKRGHNLFWSHEACQRKPITPPSSVKKVVVTSGYGASNYLASSELINSEGVCKNHTIPQHPVPGTGARSIYNDGSLLVCGGRFDGGKMQDACYKLSSSSSSWIQDASLNVARDGFSLTKVGQELYVMGGYNYHYDERLDSIEKYSDGRWELLSQKMTSGRAYHCTVYVQSLNSLIVIGDSRPNPVESLNLDSLTWTSMDPLPIGGIYQHECEVIQEDGEDTIYVTGGWATGGLQSKVWKYKSGSWSQAGHFFKARSLHSMGIVDGSLIVAGGDGGENGDRERLDSVEMMDSEGQWKTLQTSLSDGRYLHSMAAVPAEAFPCLT